MSARIQRHLNHCPEWDVRKYYQPFYHFISRINRKEIKENTYFWLIVFK